MKIKISKPLVPPSEKPSESLLREAVARAKCLPDTLLSETRSGFDDKFTLPSDIHRLAAGELSNLMAKIASYRSFLLARISVMRVALDEARSKYRHERSRRIRTAHVTESKKWLMEADLDCDPVLRRLDQEYLSWEHAVSIVEAWATGLEEKHTTLSREITIRQQDFNTHRR